MDGGPPAAASPPGAAPATTATTTATASTGPAAPPVEAPAAALVGGRRAGAVADLFPGYFALVMATGMIAIGAVQLGLDWLAWPLFVVAGAAYGVLAVLTALRLVRFPGRFGDDLTSHARGFAFLTIVAGTNVLGVAAGLIADWWGLSWVLWVLGMVLWPALVYPAVIGVILRTPKPAAGAGMNGTWFLLTVATQSVAVLGALLLRRTGDNQFIVLVCLCAFTLGVVLYLVVMANLFLRWTTQVLDPGHAEPPAWIAAGAVAISVLAGSNLLLARSASERVDRLAPFLEGVVVLCWATATFWLPVMVAIGVWRHVFEHVPLRYHPSFWSLVFPIGMYGASTYRMIAATGFDVLDVVPRIALGFALAAWALTFAGLVGQLAGARGRRSSPSRFRE